MSGPILLFFATQVLLPQPAGSDEPPGDSFSLVRRQFFLLLVGVEIWVVCSEMALGAGSRPSAVANIVGIGIFFTMALSDRVGVHRAATGLAWILFLVDALLHGVGVMT